MPKFNEVKKELLERGLKEQVFNEGCRILKEEGWAGFTMDKLAQGVGVSKGTLYNYFKNKLDVVVYINEKLFLEVAADIEADLGKEGDCRDILQDSVRRSLTKMEKFRFLRMVMVEMNMKSPKKCEGRQLTRDPENKVYKAFIKFFRRGIDEGAFKPYSPELLEVFFTAVVDGLDVSSNFEPSFQPSNKETMEQIINMILDAICLHPGDKRAEDKR